MKRFQVFAGRAYYPGAGWEDWHSEYDTQDDAENMAIDLAGPKLWEGKFEWTQVVDLERPANDAIILKRGFFY